MKYSSKYWTKPHLQSGLGCSEALVSPLCVCVYLPSIYSLDFCYIFTTVLFNCFDVAQYIIGGPTTTLDMYGYLMVSMGINGYVLVYMGIYGYICVCVGKDEHGIDFWFVNCKNYNFQFNFKGIKYWNYSNLLIVPKSWILISLGTVPILHNHILAPSDPLLPPISDIIIWWLPLPPKWFGNIWMTFDINLNKYRISLIPAAYQCTIMCGLLIEIIFFQIVFGYQWTHSYDNYLLCLDCSGTITNLLFFLLCNWLYYTTCLPVHYNNCLLFTFITVMILFVIICGVAI